MKALSLLIFMFIISPFLLFSQSNNKIDSLQRLFDNTSNDTLKIDLLLNLTKEYKIVNFKKMNIYGEQSLLLSRKIGNKEGIIYSLVALGFYYSQLSDFKKALPYIQEAIIVAKKTGNKKLIGRSFYRMAVFLIDTNDFEKSVYYAQKSLVAYQEENDKKGQLTAFEILGNIWSSTYYKKFDKAYSYYFQAKALAQELNDYAALNSINFNIAETDFSNKKYTTALVGFLECIKYEESLGYEDWLIDTYEFLGLTYLKLNQTEKGITYFNKSVKLAQNINAKVDLMEIYQSYSACYFEMGNYKMAYQHLEKYKIYSDSIFNESKSNQLVEMQTKYDTEQKETENELLRKESEIQEFQLNAAIIFSSVMILLAVLVVFLYFQLRKNKVKLERLNTTKDKFFAIIAHDLRGPITSFQGISRRMDFLFKKRQHERILEMGKDIDTAAQNINTLLDNLLNWALLQQGEIVNKKSEIYLNEIVVQAIGSYENLAQANQITLENNVPKELKITTDINAISTIIRNLLGNALKFTLANGTISISVKEEGNYLQLIVSDTGIGMSSQKAAQLFQIGNDNSTTGLRGEKGTGLGLVLCQEFAKLNNGFLKIKSELNKGTSVILSLPK